MYFLYLYVKHYLTLTFGVPVLLICEATNLLLISCNCYIINILVKSLFLN